MEELELKSTIQACQMEELNDAERHLVELAIEATSRSYAPYSHFHVGAAVLLENGEEIIMVKDGKEIGRFLPRGKVVSLAAERLRGILSKNIDADKARDEALREKYGLAD